MARFAAIGTALALLLIAPRAVPEPGAVARLAEKAESLLAAGPYSVLDKTEVAPSGDKHDYFSLSPYHWPNPDTADGLPYVYRDGELNPEAQGEAFDRDRYGAMADAVETLALAWTATGDERFAKRATLLMRAWFIDPATRMSPHFEYAQYIRGANSQRPWGIIRGIRLVDLADAVDRLEPSQVWNEADTTTWKAWLQAYVTWLTSSEKGLQESRALNNHGTWYDVQVARLSLACGNDTKAREVLRDAGDRRIARQIAPDGRQTFEMLRTKSWDYSIMNLEGLFRLAAMGEPLGVDLWHYEADDGRSIRRALDYLVPAATGERPWQGKQIGPLEFDSLYPLLMQAATIYEDHAYAEAAKQIASSEIMVLHELRWPHLYVR